MEKLYRLGETALSSPSHENKDPMGGRALYCPSCGKYYHRDFIATLNLFKKYRCVGPRAPRKPDEGHTDGSSAPEWRMA